MNVIVFFVICFLVSSGRLSPSTSKRAGKWDDILDGLLNGLSNGLSMANSLIV